MAYAPEHPPPLVRRLAPLAAVVVLLAGRAIPRQRSLLAHAALDESAHLATTTLALAAVGARDRRFVVAALAAGVLIDLDHLPAATLDWQVLTAGSPRPYPHSLASVAAVLTASGLAPARWRRPLLGTALGLASHFLRDATDGTPGLPLLWPLSRRGVRLPALLQTPLLLIALRLARGARPSGWRRPRQRRAPAARRDAPGTRP